MPATATSTDIEPALTSCQKPIPEVATPPGDARLILVFRRRAQPPVPPWKARLERARELVLEQRPPDFVVDRLDQLERALSTADEDRSRLRATLDRLDLDRAASELKAALRRQDTSPSHSQLVASLRARYESINSLHNRVEDLDRATERALVDLDLIAAKSVELGSRDERWRLDEAVSRLADDLSALESARREVTDL